MVAECDKAGKWLAEKQQAQGSLRQTDDPVLTAEDIRKREGTVLRFCEPLLSKPPPPPPKVRVEGCLHLAGSRRLSFLLVAGAPGCCKVRRCGLIPRSGM